MTAPRDTRDECQLCRLLDYRGDDINEPEGMDEVARDDGGTKIIHCCERCSRELFGESSQFTPYEETDGGTLVTDGGEEVGRAIAHRAEELRRDEFLKLEAPEESYPVYRWKVGGKEPDGTPTRIGKWTFATKMVRDIVLDALPEGRILNACAGQTKLRKRGCEFVRNDIDEDRDADLHVDVREVHEHFEPASFDAAVLDPPFDPGRAAKLYEGWHGQEYSTARDAVGAVVEPGGVVVELGWNSYSLGDKDGWETEEWYVYPQASFKGDVHLTVDRKVNQQTLVATNAPRGATADE